MIINILLSILGLIDSALIAYAKKHPKGACSVKGGDCGGVLNSKYSKTFGVENHYLGALFYSSILLLTLSIMRADFVIYYFQLQMAFLVLGVVGASFSAYFVYIMFRVLKQHCDYCLFSAALNFALLINILFFANFRVLAI